MKVHLATALLRLLAWLPLPLLYRLGWVLGWLLRFIPWRGHAIVRTNLALCFPELDRHQREQIYRQHLVETARLVLETGAVSFWSAKHIDRHIRSVEGWPATRELIESGRGTILVGAHFGNWEMLPLWLSLNTELTALYKAPRDAGFDHLITQTRGRFGCRMVASGSAAMRRLLAGLRGGQAVGILADQQPKQGEGVFVPFFGQPALSGTLLNRLAHRTGAAVVFISARRLDAGRGWALRLVPADEAIADADPYQALTVMHGWLEDEIRRDPAQYLWSYKRFSMAPPGQSSPYPVRKKHRRN